MSEGITDYLKRERGHGAPPPPTPTADDNAVSLGELAFRSIIWMLTAGGLFLRHLQATKGRVQKDPVVLITLVLQSLVLGYAIQWALINYYTFYVGRIKRLPLSRDKELRADEGARRH